jgi:hypothetical protein
MEPDLINDYHRIALWAMGVGFTAGIILGAAVCRYLLESSARDWNRHIHSASVEVVK